MYEEERSVEREEERKIKKREISGEERSKREGGNLSSTTFTEDLDLF